MFRKIRNILNIRNIQKFRKIILWRQLGAACGLFSLQFEIVVAEVLAALWQLMMHQQGQYLL